ncbi:hypothetical protein HPO96_20910 [Kribbella sandramycini]|uniref:Arsenate reductase n=1 Tax=Kribbella sandramycini TaxID=60450 RepID=A0A7Y4P235_9ACTN|nr:hypothetical protein [Kribbella sandramycini]MBB6566636.1 hypothetical protein [Kribbella sandramycini]NOL42709.1 hypothetical protein [Kribbella sandramycini]
MTSEPPADLDWAPQACTLPTAARPLRLAEFDELFRTGLLALDRLSPTALRLHLTAASEPTARDLTARESSCCSFFTFDHLTTPSDGLLLDVTVPTEHVDVLDGLAARAAAAAEVTT